MLRLLGIYTRVALIAALGVTSYLLVVVVVGTDAIWPALPGPVGARCEEMVFARFMPLWVGVLLPLMLSDFIKKRRQLSVVAGLAVFAVLLVISWIDSFPGLRQWTYDLIRTQCFEAPNYFIFGLL